MEPLDWIFLGLVDNIFHSYILKFGHQLITLANYYCTFFDINIVVPFLSFPIVIESKDGLGNLAGVSGRSNTI